MLGKHDLRPSIQKSSCAVWSFGWKPQSIHVLLTDMEKYKDSEKHIISSRFCNEYVEGNAKSKPFIYFMKYLPGSFSPPAHPCRAVWKLSCLIVNLKWKWNILCIWDFFKTGSLSAKTQVFSTFHYVNFFYIHSLLKLKDKPRIWFFHLFEKVFS